MSDLDLKEYIGGHCVSTVRLRCEHGWGGDLDGYWYETYIFPANGAKITDWIEEWGTRYRTEDEAREGHAHTVALVEAGKLP